MTLMLSSLIKPDDHASLWAVIAIGTATSIWLEQNYRWAARLSGPVVALIIGMLLSNFKLIPMSAPAYDFIGNWLVPLAIPLLLFRANIFNIIRDSGKTFIAFHISAVGTVLGAILCILLLKNDIPWNELVQAAGIMTGSYMGGGVNFGAVKETFEVSSQITNPLIVADNFVMAVMFIVLLAIGTSRWFLSRYPHPHAHAVDTDNAKNLASEHWKRKDISLLDVAWSFAFAFVVVALGFLLVKGGEAGFDKLGKTGMLIDLLKVLLTNQFVMITLLTIIFATLMTNKLKNVNGPEELGTYMLSVFLFTLGPPADIVKVVVDAPLFFVLCGIIAITNLIFTLSVGKLFKLDLEDLLISVNAALGGAPSAAAMAVSAGWPKMVLPGILVGVWGYVIGTPCAVMLVEFFSK